MYYLDENSKRVYTLAKVDPSGRPTFSAHPGELYYFSCDSLYSHTLFTARFSPEDRYAQQRIMIKKRFGLLLTQKNQLHAAN